MSEQFRLLELLSRTKKNTKFAPRCRQFLIQNIADVMGNWERYVRGDWGNTSPAQIAQNWQYLAAKKGIVEVAYRHPSYMMVFKTDIAQQETTISIIALSGISHLLSLADDEGGRYNVEWYQN